MALSILNGTMKLSIMTFNKTTQSIIALNKAQNNIESNDAEHNNRNITFSIISLSIMTISIVIKT